MKVAVYAVALNEVSHVGRFLQTCRGADLVVVTDTGSTDGTAEALRAGGATVHTAVVKPWRFDVARNTSLALVPADVDVCVSLDLDEVLSLGWRDIVQAHWTAATTVGHYRYVSSHLPGGGPGTEIVGTKIHTRFGYRWRHICHEVLVPDRTPHVETWLPGLRVDHWPTSKDRSQYLPLMHADAMEDPTEARHPFLLGRELVYWRRWAEAEPMLHRFLDLAGERFPNMRAATWRRLAVCRARQDDPAGAERSLQEALLAAPDTRDVWLDLAEHYAGCAQWAESYAASTRGLALDRGTENDHAHAGGRPYWRASTAARHLGRLREAAKLAAQAHEAEPDEASYAAHLAELLRMVSPA